MLTPIPRIGLITRHLQPTTTPPSSENLCVTVTSQQGSLIHISQWTLAGPKAFSPTTIGGCVHRRTRRERQNRRDVIDREWRARNELRPILRERSAFFVGRMYNSYTPLVKPEMSTTAGANHQNEGLMQPLLLASPYPVGTVPRSSLFRWRHHAQLYRLGALSYSAMVVSREGQ